MIGPGQPHSGQFCHNPLTAMAVIAFTSVQSVKHRQSQSQGRDFLIVSCYLRIRGFLSCKFYSLVSSTTSCNPTQTCCVAFYFDDAHMFVDEVTTYILRPRFVLINMFCMCFSFATCKGHVNNCLL